jgi:transcriptional regulator with XRE-family HTH domain
VQYARATIARNLIRDRTAAGLTQRQLAKLAGVPVETLCRIETGRRTPSVPTIDKIDRALRKALAKPKER